MTEPNYYTVDAISASGLKALKKSPAHYRAMADEPFETTPGQIVGSATHCAILEPELFDTRYTVMPDGLDLRSKAGQEAYALIQAAGKERLSQVQMDDIRAMQSAAMAHPVYARLLELDAQYEAEFYFSAMLVDQSSLLVSGVPAKMKPDLIIPPCPEYPNGLVLDLKTCGSALSREFARTAIRMDMHIQAAFYVDNLARIWGTDDTPEFWWMAIETKRPHLNCMYAATRAFLDKGREEVDTMLQLYVDCTSSGEWHGYTREVEELDIPTWFYDEGEVKVEFLEDDSDDA
jgi:hypothetical protein